MTKSLTKKQARKIIRNHVQAFICPYEPHYSEDVTRFYQLVPILQIFPDADLDDLCCQVLEAIVH
ncbi:hypothetical protein [Colwellia sp. BRX8-9]|uniref:hypothetical protein n=1 Tax=Colwellia sp. BRX8-9 TaxID=2759831 RepID=UPI0015F63958|nr:hypothetical protein [Colwellia sp. BRX8-9]MBA6348334.1 hypothetical protein [Colwellia sp. BRX8-9]